MISRIFLATALFALTLLPNPAKAETPKPLTAFQAQGIAMKSVPQASQSQLVEIEGGRSDVTLTPDTWHFVFWDSTAKQNGRLITVTHGAVTEIRDGYFELDKFRMFAYKPEEVIDPRLLRIDSDKALEVVVNTSQLKDIRLSSVTFQLAKDKDLGQPIWKLEILADNAGTETDLGYARVSAISGGIIEMKIDLQKLQKKSS